MILNKEDLVLEVFFKDSSKQYHIRSLARATGLNPNTIISVTDRLEKDNFLVKQRDEETNMVFIESSNSRSFILEKIFYNIKSLFNLGLIDYLNKKLSYPTIIIFGSYAKGDNNENSDIDLCIVSSEKNELNLSKFEKLLSAELQTFIYTKKEFDKLGITNPELKNNILNGIKVGGFVEVY